MSPNQLFPLAITLALAQGMAGALQHARSYDVRTDTFDIGRPVLAPPLRIPEWVRSGLREEATEGALADPELASYAWEAGAPALGDAAAGTARPQRP